MILVSVCDHKSFYFLNVLFQICHIRNNEIDSEHIIFWECKTAVHNNNTVFKLKGSNVHSDLLQTSKRNDTQFSVVFSFQFNTSMCLSVLLFPAFFTLSVEFQLMVQHMESCLFLNMTF